MSGIGPALMFPFKSFVQIHVANITVKRFVLLGTVRDKKRKRLIDFVPFYVNETLTELIIVMLFLKCRKNSNAITVII